MLTNLLFCQGMQLSRESCRYDEPSLVEVEQGWARNATRRTLKANKIGKCF